jgi:hypothetical protein
MSLKKLLELNAKYAGGQNYLMKKYGLWYLLFFAIGVLIYWIFFK